MASNALAEDAVDFAASLIGRPYVWGAEGPRSFDCSGLTQYVYERFGIDLPRRAIDQSQFGRSTGRRLLRGDLLFFSTDPGGSLVTHVALYEGNDMLIEASKRYGRVSRDSLEDPYLADRYMFARHVDYGTDTEPVSRRDGREDDPIRRSNDKRQVAVRVLERVAGELFKMPRR